MKWNIGHNLLNFLNITLWVILKKFVSNNFVLMSITTAKSLWTFHYHSILKILEIIALIIKSNSWSKNKKNAKLNIKKVIMKKWIKKDKTFSNQFTAFLDLISSKAKLKPQIVSSVALRIMIKNVNKKKTSKIILEYDFTNNPASGDLIFYKDQSKFFKNFNWFYDTLRTNIFTNI